ncbi:unnamed protein product [Diatraea saccharalis]|uniref:Uncharacterized protein n=1 Tax=Diatraea saccharalis TaxID=40085 RepID=A0A9N9R0W0_9NEOP|nr:unnamed protein product [Diatraea saccharalis]
MLKIATFCCFILLIVEGGIVKRDVTTSPNLLNDLQTNIEQLRNCVDQSLASVVSNVNEQQLQPVFNIVGDTLNRVSKAVNAYVKRDAPAPTQQNYIEDVKKQFEDISKSIGQQLQHAINPDEIKKHLNEFTENVNKAVNIYFKY